MGHASVPGPTAGAPAAGAPAAGWTGATGAMSDGRIPSPGASLDVSAIAALFRDHHAELVRLALLMLGDLAAAEDVGAGRLRQPAPQEPRPRARPDGRGSAAVRPGRRAQRLPFGPAPPRHRAPGRPGPPRLADRRDDGAGLGRERSHAVRGPQAGARRSGPAA